MPFSNKSFNCKFTLWVLPNLGKCLTQTSIIDFGVLSVVFSTIVLTIFSTNSPLNFLGMGPSPRHRTRQRSRLSSSALSPRQKLMPATSSEAHALSPRQKPRPTSPGRHIIRKPEGVNHHYSFSPGELVLCRFPRCRGTSQRARVNPVYSRSTTCPFRSTMKPREVPL